MVFATLFITGDYVAEKAQLRIVMGSHVVDSFRDLHDALSAPVGGLKGNDRKVAGGKRSESRQR